MLDDYIGEEIYPLKEQLKETLGEYRRTVQELNEQDYDEEKRQREAELLSFEINEIESTELDKYFREFTQKLSSIKFILRSIATKSSVHSIYWTFRTNLLKYCPT